MSSVIDWLFDRKEELKFKDFVYYKNEKEILELSGDLFSKKDFLSMVANGSLIDYDGHGKLATETQESNVYVRPSMMFHKNGALKFKFPKWATHVIWFNR